MVSVRMYVVHSYDMCMRSFKHQNLGNHDGSSKVHQVQASPELQKTVRYRRILFVKTRNMTRRLPAAGVYNLGVILVIFVVTNLVWCNFYISTPDREYSLTVVPRRFISSLCRVMLNNHRDSRCRRESILLAKTRVFKSGYGGYAV
jgi:hypothetical protein